MPKRHRDPPRPHFFEPELPDCVHWRPRRRWPLGVVVQARALTHLTALLEQRPAVWADKDPEAVHQIRVATRRLRSTLQTFATLWPDEDARRWVRELGRFAQAFGEARDLDVRLAECAADRERTRGGSATGDDEDLRRARDWLADSWRQRRSEVRHDLRRALVRFEQAWTPQRLMEFFSTTPLDLWQWSAEQDPEAAGDDGPPGPAALSTDASMCAQQAPCATGDELPADEEPEPEQAQRAPAAADQPDTAPPSPAQPGATPADSGERRAPRLPARRTPRA